MRLHHTYAQKTDDASPSLSEATSDIIHATLTKTCVDNVQGKTVVQLSDATPLQHTASTLLLDETETLLHDTTSTSTYELLDETSTQGATNKQLPEATVTSTHELPDKTSSPSDREQSVTRSNTYPYAKFNQTKPAHQCP